jgi:hypothetical protein
VFEKKVLSILPHLVIDCDLTLLAAGVHHGVTTRPEAFRLLARAQRDLEQCASIEPVADNKDTNSSSKDDKDENNDAASSNSNKGKTSNVCAESRHHLSTQHAIALHARMLVIAYCLRAEVSPLTLERMRDVLQHSSNSSTGSTTSSTSSSMDAPMTINDDDDDESKSRAEVEL